MRRHQKNETPTHSISYHEHNEHQRIIQVIKNLREGLSVGLVSDAGTPLISDPGYQLVSLCHKKNIPVVSIPGPSAVTAALSISGLPTDKFTYLGFLPRKPSKQVTILKSIKQSHLNQTIVIYESPNRFKNTLISIQNVWGDIEVTLIRELTKVHESVKHMYISQWLENDLPKGECIILFHLKQTNKPLLLPSYSK